MDNVTVYQGLLDATTIYYGMQRENVHTYAGLRRPCLQQIIHKS